nr:HD domain-containing protein [Marinifilum sp. N1E240]
MFERKKCSFVRYFNFKNVNQEIYENIVSWFEKYTESLVCDTEEIQVNLDLKKNHSFNTTKIIEALALTINMSEVDILLAKSAAILHDVGRFEQLLKYNTFADTDQINHIDLGIAFIKEQEFTSLISDEELEIILDCIKYHTGSEIPKSMDEKNRIFIQLIREADRIDILNIVSKYYSNYKPGSNKRLEMELADKPDISKKVFKSIMDEKVVDYKDVLTLNDLKLQQMSWIFDLNLKQSFRIVSEKTYLKLIYDTLPKKDSVIDMYRQMKIFLENEL